MLTDNLTHSWIPLDEHNFFSTPLFSKSTSIVQETVLVLVAKIENVCELQFPKDP